MKAIQSMTLIGAMGMMFMGARLANAQVLTDNVGVPLGTFPDGVLVFVETAHGGQVIPIGGSGFTVGVTTTSPGDLILVNPTGGNAPSNWVADIRFFNPADPTGKLALPATETVAFFAGDVGSGGFAAFQLFPKYNLVPASLIRSDVIEGSESFFGPIGGIQAGQFAVLNFIAFPASSVPEPRTYALLGSLSVVGGGFLVSHRRRTSITKR